MVVPVAACLLLLVLAAAVPAPVDSQETVWASVVYNMFGERTPLVNQH